MTHETTPPADDPTLTALRQGRATVQHDEAARLQAAVEDRPDVREAREAARAARAWLAAFRAEHGVTLRTRRAELLKPETARLSDIAPLRHHVLDEISAIEELLGNAETIRQAEERLSRLTLAEAAPGGFDAPFQGSIVATMVERLRLGSEAPRALHERWVEHERTWAKLGQRLTAHEPVLTSGNSQQPERELETPRPPKSRFAKSSLRSGDTA